MKQETLNGFSRWSKEQKLVWVCENLSSDARQARVLFESFQYDDEWQEILDGFSENTLTNFPMPYGIAPHFVINGREYAVPMVIEESSVVAAASAAAKFWKTRGGIKAEVIETQKEGQVHFYTTAPIDDVHQLQEKFLQHLEERTAEFTANMRARGGGLKGMIMERISDMPHQYQARFAFETCDSMGANFINSVLEEAADILLEFLLERFPEEEHEIVMAILSNYTPNCIVRASVECPIEDLGNFPSGLTANEFAAKFHRAISIARNDVFRATTHNKGIYNGIDAVVIATGNDFRAVEAAGHAFAARDGQYRSLSHCTLQDGHFRFWLEIPLALGTVGGLTKLHPLAALSLKILGQPNACTLMEIVAATGLAQNFAAIRSLVTVGIQKGHMKMHLNNILTHFQANVKEKSEVLAHFEDKVVSFGAVRNYLERLRGSSSHGQDEIL
jgi:hydroxymethylglutaryl-CoA reductase